MKLKIILLSLFAFIICCLICCPNILADENHVIKYRGLKDENYVLYLPDSTFITNRDGSANFTLEQISETNGEVITVSEAKKRALNLPTPKESEVALVAGRILHSYSYTVRSGQSASETVFGPGWQKSRYFYNPGIGTGQYLLWTTFGDSGLVGTALTYTAIYPGSSKYIDSDQNRGTYIWGVQYKTYNAPYGTYFTVSNW